MGYRIYRASVAYSATGVSAGVVHFASIANGELCLLCSNGRRMELLAN